MLSRQQKRGEFSYWKADRIMLLVLCHLLWILDKTLVLATRQSHYIHWNTSNPIFRIDNTDHIIDVNQGNQPWEYDQVNIVCPLYRPDEANSAEKYIIYSVSKEEYDSCRIMSTNPRVIAQCTQPHQLMYFTITFRSFTPTPGGMEFKPGRDYYFISTSSHSDVERRVGGRCSTHNMKVQFKVADNQHESPPSASNHVNRRRRPLLPSPSTTSSSTSSSTTTTTSERSNDNPYVYDKLPRYYGDLSYYPVYDGSEYDRVDIRQHENNQVDLVKHEASRMAAAAASGSAASSVLISSSVSSLLLSLASAAAAVISAAAMQHFRGSVD